MPYTTWICWYVVDYQSCDREDGEAQVDQEFQIYCEQDEDHVHPVRQGYIFGTCPTLELPKDISGGPWYVEQEFDLEFISVMSKFVQKVLREDVCASSPSHQ